MSYCSVRYCDYCHWQMRINLLHVRRSQQKPCSCANTSRYLPDLWPVQRDRWRYLQNSKNPCVLSTVMDLFLVFVSMSVLGHGQHSSVARRHTSCVQFGVRTESLSRALSLSPCCNMSSDEVRCRSQSAWFLPRRLLIRPQLIQQRKLFCIFLCHKFNLLQESKVFLEPYTVRLDTSDKDIRNRTIFDGCI
jgi:hypothetical protein